MRKGLALLALLLLTSCMGCLSVDIKPPKMKEDNKESRALILPADKGLS